jgi:hypothetical protein
MVWQCQAGAGYLLRMADNVSVPWNEDPDRLQPKPSRLNREKPGSSCRSVFTAERQRRLAAMVDLHSAVLEHAGNHEHYGVGAIRIFSAQTCKTREQVTELIPNQKLSYVLLSGLPLRDYRADVCLIPSDDGGTLVSWTASFQCAYGTGWLW